MIIIFDKVAHPKKFPLLDSLRAIREKTLWLKATRFVITRFGGMGSRVWTYESQLDEGKECILDFQALEELASDQNSAMDELLCISGSACFGINDSSFMFFQSEDKHMESFIASKFCDTKSSPDIPLCSTTTS